MAELKKRSIDDLELIITHPGRAHRDDYLSVCYLLARCPNVSLERRMPMARELASRKVAVLDVGGRHSADLRNFDHHQDRNKLCSLSLLLQAEGRYSLARRLWQWLEPTEIFDTSGPKGLARWLGYDDSRKIIATFSPIEKHCINMFGACSRLKADHHLHALMLATGIEMLREIDLAEQRLAVLEYTSSYEEIENIGVFRTRLPHAGDMPTVLELFVDRNFPDTGVVVSDDVRGGAGWLLFTRPTHRSVVNFSGAKHLPFVVQVGSENGAWCKTSIPLSRDAMASLLQATTMNSCL